MSQDSQRREPRVGVVGIVVEDRQKAAQKVNQMLSDYGEVIVGRMGIPYRDRGVSVIALIVDGDTDVLGALTGRLGGIPGVRVRLAFT
jgi:putative iron-only hydrogenase system regulator